MTNNVKLAHQAGAAEPEIGNVLFSSVLDASVMQMIFV